jgi:hypothetical protein
MPAQHLVVECQVVEVCWISVETVEYGDWTVGQVEAAVRVEGTQYRLEGTAARSGQMAVTDAAPAVTPLKEKVQDSCTMMAGAQATPEIELGPDSSANVSPTTGDEHVLQSPRLFALLQTGGRQEMSLPQHFGTERRDAERRPSTVDGPATGQLRSLWVQEKCEW